MINYRETDLEEKAVNNEEEIDLEKDNDKIDLDKLKNANQDLGAVELEKFDKKENLMTDNRDSKI